MTGRGIEIRLQKLESHRRKPDAIYFVWGATDEEIDGLLSEAVARGELGPDDPTACVICQCEPMPVSGWRDHRQLTEAEHKMMRARLEQIAGPREEANSPRDGRCSHLSFAQLLAIALGRKPRRRSVGKLYFATLYAVNG